VIEYSVSLTLISVAFEFLDELGVLATVLLVDVTAEPGVVGVLFDPHAAVAIPTAKIRAVLRQVDLENNTFSPS
jgi:hypothetical protein